MLTIVFIWKMRESGSFHIPAVHRVAMCNVALKESDWISTTAWESKRAKFSYINETVEYVCARYRLVNLSLKVGYDGYILT
jgi:nicotinic acid mononucleotide adenylyltransferase